MATHSSILTGKPHGLEEPGGLQSMGSPRVRHDLATECTCSLTGEKDWGQEEEAIINTRVSTYYYCVAGTL